MPKHPKKPIYVRIEDEMRKDFDSVLDLTGLGETQFVKAAIRALVEYVREHGEIRLPLAIIPKSKLSSADADAGGPSGTARDTRAHSINEEPNRGAKPKPPIGPRARSTAPGVAKTVGREKGKL